jgi:prepilin-type N-terminal cleavage/methylation domain-containing protein
MPIPRTHTRERGATLIEVMIALVVLTVGILAVAQLFPVGSGRQARDRMLTTANYLAVQKVEQLTRLTWNDADLAVGTHGPETVGETGRFSRRWIVESMPAPLTNLRKVTVEVGFTAYRGDTISTSTYLRR